MEQRKKSIFPHKLWQMVNNRQLDPAIRWTEDGQAFQLSENELKNLCLGKENRLFYTRNPKSFVRQLHLYGFRKIGKNKFTHQFFQRDKPFLIDNIKRSYRDKPHITETIKEDDQLHHFTQEVDFNQNHDSTNIDNIMSLESLVQCEPIEAHQKFDTCEEYQFYVEADNMFGDFLYI